MSLLSSSGVNTLFIPSSLLLNFIWLESGRNELSIQRLSNHYWIYAGDIDDVQHHTGAQIFLMATYEKPEGTIALSKYDLHPIIRSLLMNSPRFQTKPRQGNPFTEVMPMWKLRTWDSWSKYAQAHFSKHQSFL